MIKYFQYSMAYISLIILWIISCLILLNIFNIISFKTTPASIIPGLMLGYLYHKYRPMEFKELIKLMRDKLTKKE